MLSDLQVLFEQCEAQRKQILEAVTGLNASQLTYQPRPDVWSLLEEVHHLTLADQHTVRLASNPETVARLAEKFKQDRRPVPFAIASLIMRLGIRVPVPIASVLPTREHSLSTLTVQWENARDQMRCLLETIDKESARRPFTVHPVCGPLTPEQVLKFLLVHGQYHLRHMKSLRHSRKFPR